MEGNNELILVVGVVGGLIAGFFIGWLSRTSDGGGKDEELERCREELERYRNEVGSHFARTAELVGQMTAQYRAVYEHLAEGAHRLGGEQATRLEAAIVQGESLLSAPVDNEAPEQRSEAGEAGAGTGPASEGDEDTGQGSDEGTGDEVSAEARPEEGVASGEATDHEETASAAGSGQASERPS